MANATLTENASPNDTIDQVLVVLALAEANLTSGLDTAKVAATLDTDAGQGANAAQIFTAKEAGEEGNNIRIQISDDVANPGTPYITYDVGGGYRDININIDSGVTTADAITAVVNADPNLPVTVADKGGNDGSGVVVAQAEAALAGGAGGYSGGGDVDTVKALRLVRSAKRRIKLADRIALSDVAVS